MSTHKTTIEQTQVENFLEGHFQAPSPHLEKITDGESSQAYLFDSENGKQVLRVNSHSGNGFKKDSIAQERFGSMIPIPQVLEMGEIEPGVFFAVSERAEGKTLDKFDNEGKDKLVPEVISTLDIIHAQEPFGEGFGQWDENGKGKYKTWREELEASNRQDDDATKAADFYDAEFHNLLREEARRYFQYCPEIRQLVHGDFGFNNVVSDGKAITGVFDWEQSMYGDPLYDVAWLDFWDSGRDYETIFREHYKKEGRLPDNYKERVFCYKLQIGLGSMNFYARSRQKDKYDFAKGVVERMRKYQAGLEPE